MNNISVRHLTKKFKGFTLQDVSFDVPAGSVVGFIGENGAGKSTTIKSILGLVLPDGGNIRVFGKEASALTRADRGRIGAVLGECCLPENLNIKDLSEVMKNIFGEWEEDTYYRLTDAFSLPRDRKIKEFSTGMRQKAALAIALSHRAELLVLDEPASGLDPVARDEILDRLYDFMQQESHSVFISSHIVSDLEKLCDYIVFIHAGKIVFAEEKDVLKEKYAIFRGSSAQLSALDCAAVVSRMEGEYGVSALVLRDKVPSGLPLDRAGIEDIMLYFSRGVK
ncbi:MAG TPA: ABC transporter ATP-binding protein [Candidatus Borkfalkia excrementavium]|uniref:ABC transporter ATP-binding protein n=1 Tax=Candidatus Borkfalkia excrementavium TaxID=2838505 RepID=A0A9D1Z711_9FIRM|nr:ABC transporter ATP-binding protein [Candidatus Borkfalkia excrementavium]